MSLLPTCEEGEIVVVGGGPAGAAAAMTLARLGREVVLVDQNRFPRDKACGDGIWGSAIMPLQRLGFDRLIDDFVPIEGVVVRRQSSDQREKYEISHSAGSAPRCIPRKVLDNKLVDAAIDAGARFTQGRVQQFVVEDGRATSVIARRPDSSAIEVRGRYFVVADGATSRLRRLSGMRHPVSHPRAYAVRLYVRTEKPIDPVFEVRLPIQVAGKSIPGYAWIFPAGGHTANVGIGIYVDPSQPRGAFHSIRELLERFVSEIDRHSRASFGDTEALCEPLGAPLAITYDASNVKRDNMIFVGDAAQMTDPLLGEGIGTALISGEQAAKAVHDSIRRGSRPKFGERLQMQFPRLGQDLGLVVRAYDRLVESSHGERPALSGVDHPAIDAVWSAIIGTCDEAMSVDHSEAIQIATSSATERNSVRQAVFGAFRTEFPFATELLLRRLYRGAGPTALSVMMAAGLAQTDVDETAVAVALAGEMLLLSVHYLGQVSHGTIPGKANLGDGIATLIADHAMSRALRVACPLGPRETMAFARMSREVFEGAMTDAEDDWNIGRTAERYFVAAEHREGAVHAHAAGLGARLGGNALASRTCSEYGRNLGIALRIANDVRVLCDGDLSTGERPGSGLRYGKYELPVIYALEEAPGIAELLAPDAIEKRRDEAVERIRDTHAVERCAADCERYANAARATLRGVDIEDSAALHALIQLAMGRCVEEMAGHRAQLTGA